MSEVLNKYFIFKVDKETTLAELANEKLSYLKSYQYMPGKFLAITMNGTTNAANIYGQYTQQEQLDNAVKLVTSQAFNNDYSSCLSIIHVGTYLHIPQSEVPVDIMSILGKNLFLESNNLRAFLVEAYKNINNDPKNIPAAIFKEGNDIAQLRNYNISVWVWSKALNQIIDVSKYCYSLHTGSHMESGGDFSFSLEGIRDIADGIQYGDDIVNIYKLEPDAKGQIKMSYFEKYFQQKDIVWIRFEKLELEKKRKTAVQNTITGADQLKGQIFDMIGLIENVNENTDYAITERNITVSGKDMILLLAEDASYFYPLLFAMGSDAIFMDDRDESKWFKRNVFKEGIYESFFTLGERSIKDSIGFIVNQLSNLGICPNSLFSGYEKNDGNKGDRTGQRRAQTLSITDSGDGSALLGWAEVNGIWQIIDLFVDKNLDNRRQIDAMLQKSEGTLLSQMQSLCQHPFVEFTGDTFGDKYVFFAREPLFTKKAVHSFIKENYIIEIDSKDVYSQNLDWETQFYTSYEIKPNASFLGYDRYVSLSYIPIIFLSAIAEDYGNHPYSISDSYIDERALSGKGNSPAIDDFFRFSVIRDLSYLVEINSYLPFTRKGTIIINGDRRIKKGTWVYFKPTNEIFYVSSVTQSFSCSSKTVDRTTTLTVERGMIRDFALGATRYVDKKPVNVSYFDIVDVTLMETVLIETLVSGGIVTPKPKTVKKAKFDVNKDVYNFFKQRKQLETLDYSNFFGVA